MKGLNSCPRGHLLDAKKSFFRQGAFMAITASNAIINSL